MLQLYPKPVISVPIAELNQHLAALTVCGSHLPRLRMHRSSYSDGRQKAHSADIIAIQREK
jgi:hypothetical protein